MNYSGVVSSLSVGVHVGQYLAYNDVLAGLPGLLAALG